MRKYYKFWFSKRFLVCILAFIGEMNIFTSRANLNMAILDMTGNRTIIVNNETVIQVSSYKYKLIFPRFEGWRWHCGRHPFMKDKSESLLWKWNVIRHYSLMGMQPRKFWIMPEIRNKNVSYAKFFNMFFTDN